MYFIWIPDRNKIFYSPAHSRGNYFTGHIISISPVTIRDCIFDILVVMKSEQTVWTKKVCVSTGPITSIGATRLWWISELISSIYYHKCSRLHDSLAFRCAFPGCGVVYMKINGRIGVLDINRRYVGRFVIDPRAGVNICNKCPPNCPFFMAWRMASHAHCDELAEY